MMLPSVDHRTPIDEAQRDEVPIGDAQLTMVATDELQLADLVPTAGLYSVSCYAGDRKRAEGIFEVLPRDRGELSPAPVAAGASAATSPDFAWAPAIGAGPAVANQLRSRSIVDGGDRIGSTSWGVANASERDQVRGAQRARELDAGDAAEDSAAHQEPIESRADDQSEKGEELGHH
jgi:hypothetical protein